MRELNDWIETYLDFVENSEPPTLFKQWMAVSTIAAVLKRKCYTEWESRVYPNMYVVLVGPGGSRKGTAMYPAEDLLRSLGIEIAADAITREALIRRLDKCGEATIKEDGGIVQHSSLTIFSKELTVFLGYKNLDLITALCNWFDCDEDWKYETKQSGTNSITGVWVNLVGATTPSLLQTSIPDDVIGGGLASRLVLVYGDKKSKKVVFGQRTKKENELREKLLGDLNQIQMLHGEFILTDEFKDVYQRWYEQDEDPGMPNSLKDEVFDSYRDRRATHLRKLCMVMSASRKETEIGNMYITYEDFARSYALLTETEKKMHFAFLGRGKNPHSEVTRRIMNTLLKRRVVYRSELMEMYYRDVTPDELDMILKSLEQMKFCVTTIEGRDRKVTLTYKGDEDANT